MADTADLAPEWQSLLAGLMVERESAAGEAMSRGEALRVLPVAAPGAALGLAIARVADGELGPSGLEALLAATERQARHLRGIQLGTIGRILTDAVQDENGFATPLGHTELVVGAALTLPPRTAGARVELSARLQDFFPATLQALTDAVIDEARAKTIVEEISCADLDDAGRRALELQAWAPSEQVQNVVPGGCRSGQVPTHDGRRSEGAVEPAHRTSRASGNLPGLDLWGVLVVIP